MPFLLAVLALASVLGVFMSMGALVYDKSRVLVNAVLVNGTQNTPVDFTVTTLAGGSRRTMHEGDFQGATIGAIEITVAGFSGTSITPVFETSHDGITWTLWVTGFGALGAAGVTTKYAEDDFESPKRFVRATWTVIAAGAGTVTVRIRYAQITARGAYAPPGLVDASE